MHMTNESALPLDGTKSILSSKTEELIKASRKEELGNWDDSKLVGMAHEETENLFILGMPVELTTKLLALAKARLKETGSLTNDLRLGLRAVLEMQATIFFSIYDPITSFAHENVSRRGLVDEIKFRIKRDGKFPPLLLIHADIDSLHTLNSIYGREKVNPFFSEAAKLLAKTVNHSPFPEDCSVFGFRRGQAGDEFIFAVVGISLENSMEIMGYHLDEEGKWNLPRAIEVIEKLPWPVIDPEHAFIRMTASFSAAHSQEKELEKAVSGDEAERIGPLILALAALTERRNQQIKVVRMVGR